jgi:DNA-binding transcriptional ArsR family regulator
LSERSAKYESRERIDRIERLLENLASSNDDLISLILFLVELGWTAPVRITDIFKRMKKAFRDLVSLGVRDDITRSLISVLASKGELNVSELVRELRRIRGTASRRIVYDRLRLLEESGIVISVKRGNRRYVRLSEKYG